MLKIWYRMHFFTYWEKISLQKKIKSALKNWKLQICYLRYKRLPDRANTTVSKDLLTKRARLWQAQLEVIGDFLLPGPGVWWHWKDDGSVEFHDGPSEATHHPESPCVFQFRSRSVKAIQTSLETPWKQCSEKPKELPHTS